MVAAARAVAPRSKAPTDANKLPKFKEDDPSFILALITARYPDETVTIARLVRDLGFRDRHDDGNPTQEYYRVRAAVHALHARKLVRRSGREWGLP